MIDIKDIPECAICPKCGQPMQVIDLHAKAEKLGYSVDPDSYVINCHGYELTVEDDAASDRLRDLLLAYHKQNNTLERDVELSELSSLLKNSGQWL